MSSRRGIATTLLGLLPLVPGCALWNATGDDPAADAGPGGGGDGGGPVVEAREVRLVVSAGTVTDDLDDFPLLVSLTRLDGLAEVARADGADLEFAQGEARLAHELEVWDPSTGTIVAWVSVPLLLADADNEFTLRSAGQALPSSAVDVWTDYNAIFHLGDRTDSIGRYQLAQSGAVGDQDGVIAGGISLSAGGYLDAGDPDDGDLDFAFPDEFTVSMWLRRDGSTDTYQVFLSKGGTTTGEVGYSIETSEDAEEIYGCIADQDAYWCTDDAILPDGWILVHFMVDWSADVMRIHLNGGSGAQDDDIQDVNPDYEGNDHPFRIGANAEGDSLVMGSIDEVRVRAGTQSADWIAAEHANQRDPSDFVHVVIAD